MTPLRLDALLPLSRSTCLHRKPRLTKMGRPTVLTPELQAKFIEVLKHGNFPEYAAEACGIDRASYYLWMRKGKAGTPVYCDFYAIVKETRAKSKAALIGAIFNAGLKEKTWLAAAWLAQRHDRRLTDTINQRVTTVKDPEKLTEEQYWKELRRQHAEIGKMLAEHDQTEVKVAETAEARH